MKKFCGVFVFFSIVFTLFVEGTINVENVKMDQLDRLWHNNKKPHKLYYDFFLNGKHFKGQKAFEPRFNSIKQLVSFEGKRVLELGSNMGIFSVLLAKQASVDSITAVDRTESIVKDCYLLQNCFNVQFPALCLDFDSDEYEEKIGYNFDIVLCLRLYMWVKEKARFMNYLSKFKQVIFEGHVSTKESIERFKKAGFNYFRIGEQNIILFSKTPLN